MDKKTLIIIGIFVGALIVGIIILATLDSDDRVDILNNNGITLFYGDGCPHCEDVEEYIEENDITSKISFTELEVWNDSKNAMLMNKAIEICELNSADVGVPFVFADNKCYIGGPAVEGFFKERAGIE